jgi:arsenate reductase-like glutaredoxin family protein
MSCKKAQEFLEQGGVPVQRQTDASKEKKGRAEALALARSVRTVIVARGKKCVSIDMRKDAPDDDTLAGLILGPTGNLRAPTLQRGMTLYIGFSEAAYAQLH